MKKLRNILIVLVISIAAIFALSWYLNPQPVDVSGTVPEWYAEQRVGGYHIHTAASHDSDGTREAVAAAAHNNNLSFVVITDHNALGFSDPFTSEGVLFIPGLENSTSFGHLVAINSPRVLNEEEKKNPVAAVKNMADMAIAAHPTALKRPWTDKDYSHLDGLEVASISSDFYRLILPNRWGKLLLMLPSLWLFPGEAISLVVNYDESAWSIFDSELAKGHQLLPFCGQDAHQHFSYDWELSTYQLVTFDKWFLLDNDRIKQLALLKSLAHGDYYCRAGYLGDIRLDFKANTLLLSRQGGRVNHNIVRSFTADVFPKPAYELEYRLYRDGQLIARQKGELKFDQITTGGYRLEVWASLPGIFGQRQVPLFYSTSIILD